MRVRGRVAAQEILAGQGSAGDDRQKLHDKDDYHLRGCFGGFFQGSAGVVLRRTVFLHAGSGECVYVASDNVLNQCFQSSSCIMRFMNSSNSGTVNAVSP
jgi:hypothetical protein